MSKYSDDSIKEGARDDLLSDNNPKHINNDIDMDTKAQSNLHEDMISSNLYKRNSGINIKDLFQQLQEQIAYKRLTKKVLEQTCNIF